MTPGPSPLRLYCDPRAVWIGVQVLPGWIVVLPLPCIGIAWKRRRRVFTARDGGTYRPNAS